MLSQASTHLNLPIMSILSKATYNCDRSMLETDAALFGKQLFILPVRLGMVTAFNQVEEYCIAVNQPKTLCTLQRGSIHFSLS